MEKERERNINVREKHQLVTSLTHSTWTPGCNPGMCHDWESNWQPFTLREDAQPTEPCWPGQRELHFLIYSDCVTHDPNWPVRVLPGTFFQSC